MSRFNPDHLVEPIYDAATRWRKRCLETDGSAFSDSRDLWTPELLEELDHRFVENYDQRGGEFFDKLKLQLAPGSPSCRQLMAEKLWILMLFQTNIGTDTKRDNVRKVWSWSGEELSEDHPLLSDSVLEGIGSAGPAFNMGRHRELKMLIAGVRDFKGRGTEERTRIVSDPWSFAEWINAIPVAHNRQLRHIVPHLLYPDTFERISSETDKCQILGTYTDKSVKEVEQWDLIEIDRGLLSLREHFEKDRDTDIDFYEDEFAREWQLQTWLLSWNPTKWTWTSLAEDRLSTLAGEKVSHRWPCRSKRPRKGDRAYLMRTGVEKKGVVAVGSVTRVSYKELHWDSERADSGDTALFIDVDFEAVRDAEQDSIILLQDLENQEPRQQWNPQSSGIAIKRKSVETIERLWKALPQVSILANTEPITPENIILYGPPGTGKTFRLMTEYLPRYKDDVEERYIFVTFHQTYAYEDFVEGIRPKLHDGAVVYEVRSGPLRRICDQAKKDPNRRFALFIDEINRGNVPKIFGELISLVEIDKRIQTSASGKRLPGCKGLEVTLPYSGERFGVPQNVDVICTMNTADRSIALLDSALRRRFRFQELTPQPQLLKTISDGAGGSIDLQQLLQNINDRITHLLDRDQIIGHSYFYRVGSFDELRRIFAREILPLLQEAFYDDWRKIRFVLADQTVSEELQLVRKRVQNQMQLFPNVDVAYIGDNEAYEIVSEDEITPNAIRKIYATTE